MINRFGVKETAYVGRVLKQLEFIHRAGEIAAPVAYGLLRRLECLGMETPEAERAFWNEVYFDGCDGIAEHPSGNYKLVLDAFSFDFQNGGRFEDREFVLGDGVYEQLSGIEFTREECALNRDFTLREVLTLREWNALARHPIIVSSEKAFDERLLGQYARRCVFPNFEKAMGIYLGERRRASAWMRAACVYRLELGSQFVGGCDLVDDYGRVVGVAPKALEAARLRSFELCGRLSQMEYPALKGRASGEEIEEIKQSARRKESVVKSRHDIQIEQNGASIPKDAVQSTLAKLKQGAKYNPEMLADFELTLYLNLDKKEEEKYE